MLVEKKGVLCSKDLDLFSSFKVCVTSLVILGTEILEKIKKSIYWKREVEEQFSPPESPRKYLSSNCFSEKAMYLMFN